MQSDWNRKTALRISDLEDSNYGSTFKKSEPSLSAKEHDNECVASEEENKSNRLIKTVSKSDDNESSSEGNRVYNLNEEAYLTKYYEPTHCGSGCLMSWRVLLCVRQLHILLNVHYTKIR